MSAGAKPVNRFNVVKPRMKQRCTNVGSALPERVGPANDLLAPTNPPLRFVRAPIGGWEVDFPEIGGRGVKLQGHVKALRLFLGGPHHSARHALFRSSMFEH